MVKNCDYVDDFFYIVLNVKYIIYFSYSKMKTIVHSESGIKRP